LYGTDAYALAGCMTGPMEDTHTPERLERGRQLFNAGRYFEAHEAWEEAWLVEKGDLRLLLQGLIQIAAGCLKSGEGNASGCARLLAAGLEKLDVVAPRFGIAGFAREVADTQARALRWQRGQAPDAGSIPVLPPIDPSPAP
jgi:predicted metal-dependent hydrolase